MWEDQILNFIKVLKKDDEEDDTAGVSELMSQTTPTIDEIDECLKTLKMFVSTRPVPSEEMMEWMMRMFSIFSKGLIKKTNETT